MVHHMIHQILSHNFTERSAFTFTAIQERMQLHAITGQVSGLHRGWLEWTILFAKCSTNTSWDVGGMQYKHKPGCPRERPCVITPPPTHTPRYMWLINIAHVATFTTVGSQPIRLPNLLHINALQCAALYILGPVVPDSPRFLQTVVLCAAIWWKHHNICTLNNVIVGQEEDWASKWRFKHANRLSSFWDTEC